MSSFYIITTKPAFYSLSLLPFKERFRKSKHILSLPMAFSNGVPATGTGLIASFGEMLIDFVPTVSGVSLAEAPGFLKAPGGAPANVAIAVARLGGKAAFVGKLGDDEFGHMLAGILKENGVRADGITFDQGARTALAFVTLRADGEREFMFYRNPSADMLLQPEELNLELIRSVCIFSLSHTLSILSGDFFFSSPFPGKPSLLFYASVHDRDVRPVERDRDVTRVAVHVGVTFKMLPRQIMGSGVHH